MVDEQQFRADLFYRVNVFPITLPPLRERREDIPTLVRYFVQEFATRMRKEIEAIPAEVMETLMNYSWPGNIRELRNILERSRNSDLRKTSARFRKMRLTTRRHRNQRQL